MLNFVFRTAMLWPEKLYWQDSKLLANELECGRMSSNLCERLAAEITVAVTGWNNIARLSCYREGVNLSRQM